MKKLSFFFLILFLFVFVYSGSIKAQMSTSDALKSLSQNVSIEINPENPAENTEVVINIYSSSVDLDRARINWLVDGKSIKEGYGEKTFSTLTGKVGTSKTIEIIISPIDGDSFKKDVVLTPTQVDLLWQSNSYVPPFYEGKALFSRQSEVTVIAIPNIIEKGVKINPKNLVYTWSRNDTVLGQNSGFGKNSLTFTDSILSKPENISVLVSTTDETVSAKNSITIQGQSPSLLFYEKNPLYGILFNREITSGYKLSSKEVSFVAIPLFFSVENRDDPSLVYSWNLNKTPINNDLNKSTVTFRQDNNNTGFASIGLSLKNNNKLLQSSTKTFGLEITKNNSQNTGF